MGRPAVQNQRETAPDDRYKWVALANTTAAMFMATLDGSIVIIALPAIFRGIHLDPLAPGNISYLLWMIMGYRLVQAVLVVSVGRLGDMFGRVRIYNSGFVVFTAASVLLSFDPFYGGRGALWLIGWRPVPAWPGRGVRPGRRTGRARRAGVRAARHPRAGNPGENVLSFQRLEGAESSS